MLLKVNVLCGLSSISEITANIRYNECMTLPVILSLFEHSIFETYMS